MKPTGCYHFFAPCLALFLCGIVLVSCSSSRVFLNGYHSSRSTQKNEISIKKGKPEMAKKNKNRNYRKSTNHKTKRNYSQSNGHKNKPKSIQRNAPSEEQIAEKKQLLNKTHRLGFHENKVQFKDQNFSPPDTLTSDAKTKRGKRKVGKMALSSFILTGFNIISGFLLTVLLIDSFGLLILITYVPALAIIGLILGIVGAQRVKKNPESQKGAFFGVVAMVVCIIILVCSILLAIGMLFM